MTHRLAITPGEPAGIGPDLCIEIAQSPPKDVELVIVADPTLLQERAILLGLPLATKIFDPSIAAAETEPGQVTVIPVSLRHEVEAGALNTANAEYVLETLRVAAQAVTDGACNAMVTGPVHKGIINDAGFRFSGHTEYLADYCEQELTVMMLATEGLRVALATTHLPLSAVPAAITKELLRDIISILNCRPAIKIWNCVTRNSCLWTKPTCGRRRPSGLRGDRHHRTGSQRDARAGDKPYRSAASRHAVYTKVSGQCRCGTIYVPRSRPARAQVQGLRCCE